MMPVAMNWSQMLSPGKNTHMLTQSQETPYMCEYSCGFISTSYAAVAQVLPAASVSDLGIFPCLHFSILSVGGKVLIHSCGNHSTSRRARLHRGIHSNFLFGDAATTKAACFTMNRPEKRARTKALGCPSISSSFLLKRTLTLACRNHPSLPTSSRLHLRFHH